MFFASRAALVAAVLASVLALAGEAQAYQCKTTAEFANGKALAQNQALKRGRMAWTSSVRGEHGLPWSVYQIAAHASEECTKQGPMYQCTVSAVPCLYVVE